MGLMGLVRMLVAAFGASSVSSQYGGMQRLEGVTFNVTNLTAGALMLSHRVSYTFDVSTSPVEPPVHCAALSTTLDETLVNVSQTPCRDFGDYYDNNSKNRGGAGAGGVHNISFEWTQYADGSAVLEIYRELSDAVVMAHHDIGANETRFVGQLGNSTEYRRQVYDGPESFGVQAQFMMRGEWKK